MEDDLDLVEVISSLVEDTLELMVATTLSEVSKILANRRFDLVIFEVNLPDGSRKDLLPVAELTVEAVVFESPQYWGSATTLA